MMIPALLSFVLACPAKSAPPPRFDPNYKVSSEEVERFEFMRRRKRERDGYVVDEGDRNEETLHRAPPGHPSWEEQEKARATAFDERFGPGAYDGIVRFSLRCRALWEKETKACDYMATADLLRAAYGFVALDKTGKGDEAKLRARLRAAVELFRPKKDAPAEYADDFTAFSKPLLKKP